MGAGHRTRAVERLLRENGVVAGRVDAAGHESEIAAITAVPGEWPRIRELAARIKACGFRYVAFDLDPEASDPTGINSIPTEC